ncbi:hypothetical protein MD484_g5880, partial [Candolleomyces efflorescens]
MLDAIFDHLAFTKKDISIYRTLLRCSLVSRQVSKRCRMHLFQEVNLGWSKEALTAQESQSITTGTVPGFVGILLDDPPLSEQVHCLRVNPGFYLNTDHWSEFCDNLPIILERLTSLRSFALTHGSDPDALSVSWNFIPIAAQAAIRRCCTRSTIRSLEFRGCVNLPPSLIYSCSPSLTTLYLSLSRDASTTGPEQISDVDSTSISPRPPWSLRRLVCQNVLPLLRSVIIRPVISDEEGGPFSSLRHVNVAVLTNHDASLVAPLLLQSMQSLQSLEVSFTLSTDETTFTTNWVHLPSLQRFHVSIYCVCDAHPTLHYPPEISNLIYQAVHNQISVGNLSIHVTCQMAYVPLSDGDAIFKDDEGWILLSERLKDTSFLQLSTLRLSMSIVLAQQDEEITRGVCEDVEGRVRNELLERFEQPGRSLELAIMAQSFVELVPDSE